MKFLVFLVVVVLSTISLVLIGTGTEIMGANAGVILSALLVAYFIFSFGTVKVDEVAAKFLFGKPMGNIGHGPYLALAGIMSVRKEKGTVFQDELPAEPEKIFRGSDTEKIPEGMFPPLRLKFGQPRPEDKGTPLGEDPYNIAMVAEVVPVVSWHITDATTFFKVMGSVQNCRKVMTDKAIGVFGNKFSKVTPARAALSLFRISNDLEQTLKAETATWGVTIDDAYVKPFIFSHGLNKAVVGVEEARQNAKSARETAYGTRDKLKAEGDGAAHARRVMLLAEAIGITKLAEVSKAPEGQMTLWMETMKKAFERAQYSIVPGSEMFTAFAGISEAVKKIKTGGA